MKRWLEVAKECGCAAPDECTLFTSPEDGTELALPPVYVHGEGCRRRRD